MGNIIRNYYMQCVKTPRRGYTLGDIKAIVYSIPATPEAYALLFSEIHSDGNYNMGRACTWFYVSKIMRNRIPREKLASFDFKALLTWKELYEHMPQYQKEINEIQNKWKEYINPDCVVSSRRS